MIRPIAISNWKMAFTLEQGQAWVTDFLRSYPTLFSFETSAQLSQPVERLPLDIVICPPHTLLHPISAMLTGTDVQMGAQNVANTDNPSRMGQISAAQVADAGCQWVMLGHWEVRRYLGDDDAGVNRKVLLSYRAGLRPILLVGEGRDEQGSQEQILFSHLDQVFAQCSPEEVAQAVIIYEPEGAIGQAEPASLDQIAAGCDGIRCWLAERHGAVAHDRTPIVYGGSVDPTVSDQLLTIPTLNGLAATRKGRDPQAFGQIVRTVLHHLA